MSALRVVYMGTPDFAVPALQQLVRDTRCDIVGVISQPSRPAGRGQRETPPPVARWAADAELPVFQPPSMREDSAYQLLVDLKPDLVVVAAYGQILRQRVLDIPRLGCVNLHGSLLPRWRGAAPIHRAIEAGDAVTGISIMRMERGLDTGPVYAMEAVMIGETETTGALHDRLAALGGDLLIRTLPSLLDQDVPPVPQANDRACYAHMLTASDRQLDPTQTALQTVWRINAMSPWPGITVDIAGERVQLMRAAWRNQEATAPTGTIVEASAQHGLHFVCADGRSVEILEVKRAGRRAMPAQEALRGWNIPPGAVVANTP